MNKDPYADSPVITWNKDYLLKWEDFKNNSNYEIPASARSAVGLESHPDIQLIVTKTKFKFKINTMGIRAIFIPDASVVIKERVSEQGNAVLLRHEQGHFDLVEEIARKANLRLDPQFQNKTFTVKGKTPEEAQKEAMQQATIMSNEILEGLRKEFHFQETKYDDETNHGRIIEKQEEYNTRFEKLRDTQKTL